MSITFQRESISDIKAEIEPLIQEHYEEIANYTNKIALVPDWDRYIALCNTDVLHFISARNNVGDLIGYYIVIITPNLHYSEDLFGVCDIVFIQPQYRGTTVGYRLFKHVEKYCVDHNVSVMTMHVKVEHDFSKLMKGLGWDLAEKQFTKCIK